MLLLYYRNTTDKKIIWVIDTGNMTIQYIWTVSHYKTFTYIFIQLWAFTFKFGVIKWKDIIDEQHFASWIIL